MTTHFYRWRVQTRRRIKSFPLAILLFECDTQRISVWKLPRFEGTSEIMNWFIFHRQPKWITNQEIRKWISTICCAVCSVFYYCYFSLRFCVYDTTKSLLKSLAIVEFFFSCSFPFKPLGLSDIESQPQIQCVMINVHESNALNQWTTLYINSESEFLFYCIHRAHIFFLWFAFEFSIVYNLCPKLFAIQA